MRTTKYASSTDIFFLSNNESNMKIGINLPIFFKYNNLKKNIVQKEKAIIEREEDGLTVLNKITID